MKQFEGFPSGMKYTSVPNIFFSEVMPEIEDIDELKVVLHIFRLIYTKKGSVRFVSFNELLSDSGIIDCLRGKDGTVQAELSDILGKITDRNVMIKTDFEHEGDTEYLYFLNTEKDRDSVEKIKDGTIQISGFTPVKTPDGEKSPGPLPDIFALYEENVGMLNPMIADWLKEAEKEYPESWIRDAIKEAVSLNKRSWRYINKILENWAAEGKSDGTHRRDTKTDPGKYRKQKYDHLVRH